MSVQITLTFPDAQTAAAALLRVYGGDVTQGEAALRLPAAEPKPAAAAGKPKAEKPATESKPAADAAGTSSAATPAAASPKADAKPAVLPYDELKVRVVKLAAASKESIAPILAHFGVDHFTKVDEARRGEALAMVNEKLAQLEAVA